MNRRRIVATSVCALLVGAAIASVALAARKHRLTVPPPPAFPRALSVDETEFELRPSRLVVSSGRVRIFASNQGMDDHDLVVFDQAGNALGRTFLPPRQTNELTVTLPPGQYRVVCSLFAGTAASHEDLGMRFTLTAQDPPSSLAGPIPAQRSSLARARPAPPTRRP